LRLPAGGQGFGRRRFGLDRLAVPIGIVELGVRLHKVINREVVLAVIQPRAAPDDLLELDHRVHGPHQHDVAHVAGVHPGGEFLRRGQDGGQRVFVVLKLAQVLLAQLAVVGGHAHAVVGCGADLGLVDQVAHQQGVLLGGAKHNRLFALVDAVHEQLHAVGLALFDLDAVG